MEKKLLKIFLEQISDLENFEHLKKKTKKHFFAKIEKKLMKIIFGQNFEIFPAGGLSRSQT